MDVDFGLTPLADSLFHFMFTECQVCGGQVLWDIQKKNKKSKMWFLPFIEPKPCLVWVQSRLLLEVMPELRLQDE